MRHSHKLKHPSFQKASVLEDVKLWQTAFEQGEQLGDLRRALHDTYVTPIDKDGYARDLNNMIIDLDLLLQPKNADVQNARGSKAPAGLAADAKEQAGTANCSQTAQQKLTQLPDEAGTNARRREKAQQQTKNAPPPRSTKR